MLYLCHRVVFIIGTTHIGSGAHTRGGAQDVEGAHTGSDGGVRPAQDSVRAEAHKEHVTVAEGERD